MRMLPLNLRAMCDERPGTPLPTVCCLGRNSSTHHELGSRFRGTAGRGNALTLNESKQPIERESPVAIVLKHVRAGEFRLEWGRS